MNRKKLLYFLVLLCFAVQLFAGSALAAGRTASLTLSLNVGSRAVKGVECELYRAADLSGTTFTATAQFKAAKVELNGLETSAQWQAAANSLAVYAQNSANGVKPTASGVSDGSGNVGFSGLASGLYLAVFTPVSIGGVTYSFQPALISLPQWGSSGVSWDVTASPKGSSETVVPGGGTTDITALKIWNDSSDSARRPASITVELLRDGANAGTAVLSDTNNWRCTWSGLSDKYTWSVVETSVPDGYTVTYSADGTVIVITNTLTTTTPPTPTPSTPGTDIPNPPVPGANVPTPTPTPTTPTTGTPGTPGKLPQTGVLWWPVPALAVCGLVLFGIGWSRKNGHDEKK
jgi:hypothetical protein